MATTFRERPAATHRPESVRETPRERRRRGSERWLTWSKRMEIGKKQKKSFQDISLNEVQISRIISWLVVKGLLFLPKKHDQCFLNHIKPQGSNKIPKQNRSAKSPSLLGPGRGWQYFDSNQRVWALRHFPGPQNPSNNESWPVKPQDHARKQNQI